MVQILAVAEACTTVACAGLLGWRYVQFRKVLAHSHEDAFVGGGASGGAPLLGGGGGGGGGHYRKRLDSMSGGMAGMATPYGGPSSGPGRDRGRSRGLSLSGGLQSREASLSGYPFQTPAKRGGAGGGYLDSEAGLGGYDDSDEGAAGAGGGGAGASPDGPSGPAGSPAPSAHFVSGAAYARALERLGASQAREREAEARVGALTAELDAAHAGGGGGDLSSLLRSTTEELLELQEAHRALGARCDALEDTIGKYESELRRASGDVARFRLLLKEERRKGDKLSAAVEVGKEANARAQAAIVELNARLAVVSGGATRGGPVTADSAAAAAVAAASSSAAGGASSYQARLARTVSRQASFQAGSASAPIPVGGRGMPGAGTGASSGGGGGVASSYVPSSLREQALVERGEDR